jgi:hypothetical protein
MAERWNLKRLTRVDALVVGGICLLLIVLVPILAVKPRKQSIRRLCGANLGQIGKTMLAYANDYQGALPRAGGPATTWGSTPGWDAPDRYHAFQAFGPNREDRGSTATISSCFYLLVKYYETPTRLFICRGDKGTTEFKLSSLPTVHPSFQLTAAWDFGPLLETFQHCSYSYHIPYGPYPLTTSRDPNLAVAADRSPYLRSPMADALPVAGFKPDIDPFRGTTEQARWGNAIAHGGEGQNVLFLDGRVAFEKRSYCGVDTDNIYLVSMDMQRGSPVGMVPNCPQARPASERDSVLVQDEDIRGFRRPPLKR